MAATWRRGVLFGVLAAAALSTGCNVLALPFFIFGPEPKIPAQFHRLAPEDKDEKVKVLILAYAGVETRPEFLRVDRDLSRYLAHHLTEWFKYNKENVEVISPRKVEDYKQQHPDWHTRAPEEIGEELGADYVIDLEVENISLYAKSTHNMFYQGHAEIAVKLVDVNNADDTIKEKDFVCDYPSEHRGGPIEVGSSSPADFRNLFYNHMAKHLAWYFTSHPTAQDYRD